MLLEEIRVFMVEDDQGNAAIIQMLLEQEGARVFRGRWGGKDTLRLFEKYQPLDIVLLDLMLPNGMTGFDVLKQIRETNILGDTPVIAVSASDPATAIPRARREGFNGFIAKPVNFERFGQQVATVLQGEPVWDIGHDMDD